MLIGAKAGGATADIDVAPVAPLIDAVPGASEPPPHAVTRLTTIRAMPSGLA
jgi:hypothetical protein